MEISRMEEGHAGILFLTKAKICPSPLWEEQADD